MAIRANSRSPPIELIGLLRRDQVLGRDALPPAVAHQPGVCPDEAPTLARVFLPGLASLSDCCVAIEPYLHFVKPIRSEMLRRVTRFIDHLFLGVRTAAGIDSDEIVSKNTLNRRCVAYREWQKGPATFLQPNVLSACRFPFSIVRSSQSTIFLPQFSDAICEISSARSVTA